MKLVASLIVRNELGRYLEPCLASLLTFCDEIRVLDDGSTDGTFEWLAEQGDRVVVIQTPSPRFFEHEGRARNALLDWTFEGEPTHVLAVDADEIVSDGAAVRAACEADEGKGSWALSIEEVWKADERGLWLRTDGAWRPHNAPVLWRAPPRRNPAWRILDRQLACGREPVAIRKLGHPKVTGVSLLHLGWACEAERAARYARYVEADGGRFHASAHLRSIMWPDSKVRLVRRPWPAWLDRAALLERVRRAEGAAA